MALPLDLPPLPLTLPNSLVAFPIRISGPPVSSAPSFSSPCGTIQTAPQLTLPRAGSLVRIVAIDRDFAASLPGFVGVMDEEEHFLYRGGDAGHVDDER
jgi:hypothetical protein